MSQLQFKRYGLASVGKKLPRGYDINTKTQTVTAQDLLEMPGDVFRYGLLRGELKKMSPAGNKHGEITVSFSWRIAQYVEANDLGKVYAADTGFLLSSDPDTVLAPDVSFVSRNRIEEVRDVEGYWLGAPDLAVEVISPSDTYTEIEEKALQWLDAGTRMVILLDPRKRTLTVYRSLSDITILTENFTLDGGEVVPGWKIAIGDLFA